MTSKNCGVLPVGLRRLQIAGRERVSTSTGALRRLLIGCLSCEMGCSGGPGTLNRKKSPDEIEYLIEWKSREAQKSYTKRGLLRTRKGARARLGRLVEKYWKPGLYDQTYLNRLANYRSMKTPSASELQAIYVKTHKTRPEHFLNCSSSGYSDCAQMAIAIYNKLNRPENCSTTKKSPSTWQPWKGSTARLEQRRSRSR